MKKHAFGIALTLALIFGLGSLGLASILWKTNAIPNMKVSLSYTDPTSGAKVLKNFSGVGLNYLEVNQDLSNNYHYVVLHTENYSDMEVELSAVGGGLTSASKGTEINGTWRTGLNDNIIRFGIIPAEMAVSDMRAVVMNGSYTVNSMNASNQNITMTAAGLLTIGGTERVPAKVTVQVNAKGIPSLLGSYSSIGNDFVPAPPVVSVDPIASNISQNLAFGALAPTIDVIALSPNFSDPLTVDIPSGGGALNGTAVVSSNKVVYTPNEGFTGIDTFQYRLISGVKQSNIATVTVTVGPARPKPYAALQNYTSIPKDSNAADYAPVADWDSNFTTSVPAKSEEDGDVSVVSEKFNYKPAAGFDGQDTFTYTLTDKLARTITGTAIFEVTPHAVGDSINYSIASNSITPAITTATLLGNDKGNGLSIVDILKVGTTNGTPTPLGNNIPSGSSITYVPFSAVNGNKEYFVYTIKDAAGNMSSAVVTVNISP